MPGTSGSDGQGLTRRQVLAAAAATGLAGRTGAAAAALPSTIPTAAAAPPAPPDKGAEPFGYCLNTAVIRGARLGLVEEIKLAAQAGYGAVEPWLGEIQGHLKGGASAKELASLIADLGLKVPNVIAFPNWLTDDDDRRAKALEQAKADMDLIRQIGGTGIAAPPSGWGGPAAPDLLRAAERYRALLDLGDPLGVVPQLEIWGTSRAMSRLGQAAMIAVESGHPNACILPDVFHIYKSGGSFGGIRVLSSTAIRVFHFNDYPAEPPRERANDSHRLLPGDGVAPLTQVLKDLKAIGFAGWLSLELFTSGRGPASRPAADVAREGLAKLKAVVAKALAGAA